MSTEHIMEPTVVTKPKKVGIWTEHKTDDGRTFFFNIAHGRSYWQLPEGVQKTSEEVAAKDTASSADIAKESGEADPCRLRVHVPRCKDRHALENVDKGKMAQDVKSFLNQFSS